MRRFFFHRKYSNELPLKFAINLGINSSLFRSKRNSAILKLAIQLFLKETVQNNQQNSRLIWRQKGTISGEYSDLNLLTIHITNSRDFISYGGESQTEHFQLKNHVFFRKNNQKTKIVLRHHKLQAFGGINVKIMRKT